MLSAMSGDSAAQVQAGRLLRGARSWEKILREGLQKPPHRKGDLDRDPEQTIVNLLESRKLLKIADLENRNGRTYSVRNSE